MRRAQPRPTCSPAPSQTSSPNWHSLRPGGSSGISSQPNSSGARTEKQPPRRRVNLPLRILIGVDGTLSDLLSTWLGIYNLKYHDSIEPKHILTWDTDKYVKCGDKIYDLLPEAFQLAAPLPGARWAVDTLRSQGHDLYAVTATSHKKTANIIAKAKWLAYHFPDFDPEHVAFFHAKHLIKAHVLVDDCPANLVAYRRAWPQAWLATIPYPYNRHMDNTVDLRPLRPPPGAWEDIVKGITALSRP